MDAYSFGILWFVAIIFLFVLLVAWILFPLAVFGTKPLLRQLIAEQKETNRLLRAAVPTPAPAPAPPPVEQRSVSQVYGERREPGIDFGRVAL